MNEFGKQVEFEFYGQNGEDFLLWSLFRDKRKGFYVDVGAFDGIHLSNSYFFEKMGWDGICVEAHPEFFKTCRANRPHSRCVNRACVGPGSGNTVKFLKEELGLLSGIVADETPGMEERYSARNMKFEGFEAVEISASSLTDLLHEIAPGQRHIDFISIDTEGNELEILKGFDFNNFFVKIFLVEANDQEAAQKISNFLRPRGYVLARVQEQNLFFCRRLSDVQYLKYKRVNCKIADTLHPLGAKATPAHFRGRVLQQNDCWFTDNVLVQKNGQPLSSILDYMPENRIYDRKEKIRFVHAINPYSDPESEQHGKILNSTFESILRAKSHYGSGVRLVSVHFPEDDGVVPSAFERSPYLNRKVGDLKSFKIGRPFPLFFDVLDKAAQISESEEYLIYTNIDICLMPHFYETLEEFIGMGFDTLTINRRTIGKHPLFDDSTALSASEIGIDHPGFDCFVFRRRIYDYFFKNEACLGVAGVARGLLYNLVAFSKRMLMLKHVHLTYHFGDDQMWVAEDFSDYTAYNEKEYVKVLVALSKDIKNKTRLEKFCKKNREKFLVSTKV